MPTTNLNRQAIFKIETLHNQISGLTGWVGSTADDISNVIWDTTLSTPNRKVVVYKKGELSANQRDNIIRNVTFTEAEIYDLIDGFPGWGSGTSADIKNIEYDSGSKKITITRVQE